MSRNGDRDGALNIFDTLQIADNSAINENAGELQPPSFCLLQPEQQSVPFVFSSPHSGRYYPQSFIDSSLLDAHSIRQSEDFLVDELFGSVVQNGIPILCANYARAYLDVNREPFELDPKMFAGKLPSFANTRSIRVAGGLGTIARIVSEKQEIYRGKLDVSEVINRIANIYQPYHEQLRKILAKTHMMFGHAVLVDCHSMPSAKHDYRRDFRPDIIIGDRYGISAASEIVHCATQLLRELGYRVAINKPYAGGFITQHYGHPKDGLHTIQIEVNRGIYMDENTIKTTDGFDQLRRDLEEFVKQLVLVGGSKLQGFYPLAAE